MSLATIREQIDELSYEERVELFQWLQMTTPDEDDAYLQEMLALAEQRSEELQSGKVVGIPWEEVRRQLDQALP